MKKRRKRMGRMFLYLSIGGCLLAGCTNMDHSTPQNNAVQSAVPTPNTFPDAAKEQSVTLYIGTQADGFAEYTLGTTDEMTPTVLVQGIAERTGWDLSLADEIFTGKGGMTVVFAPEACLFTGPPEEQNEEFHVYDSIELTFMVLDSIQKTLQGWANPTNPDSVDIYFAARGDQPLALTNLGITWPLEQPYSHNGLAELLG